MNTRTRVLLLMMAACVGQAATAAEGTFAAASGDPLGRGLAALWRESRSLGPGLRAAPAEWPMLPRRSLIDQAHWPAIVGGGMVNGGLGIVPSRTALMVRESMADAGNGFALRVDTAQAFARADAAPSWLSSRASYRQGGWRAFAAFERADDWLSPGSSDQGLRLGAAYRYARTELSAGWERLRHDNEVSDVAQQAWWIGLTQRVGEGALKFNYARAGDASGAVSGNGGMRQLAFGYELGLSPQTAVYAFYTRLSNDPNGLFQLGGGEVDGNASGLGRSGISLGIRHSF